MLIIDYTFISFNARNYVFSRQIVSNQSFNDPALREILTETHISGQRVVGGLTTTIYVPFVVLKELKSYMREEFKLMIILIKCVAKLICTSFK